MIQSQHSHVTYGDHLSNWRKKRRFSQLSFGLCAEVSPRHVSFLETGRARPSREMVLKLADCLAMPKADINHALLLAGFSPAYLARSAGDTDLAPIQHAISFMLDNHMPYPAIGLDRFWNIKTGNGAAMKLLTDAGFSDYTNLLDALCDQTPQQSSIKNWQETVGLFLTRAQTEMRATGHDPAVEKIVQRLEDHFSRHSNGGDIDRSKAVIATHFGIGDQTISVFSTIASFGSVQDVILDDLKVELMFPLDDISKAYFLNTNQYAD